MDAVNNRLDFFEGLVLTKIAVDEPSDHGRFERIQLTFAPNSLLTIVADHRTDEIQIAIGEAEFPDQAYSITEPWRQAIGLSLEVVYRLVNVRNYVDGVQFIFRKATGELVAIQVEMFGGLICSSLQFGSPHRSTV